MVFPDSKRMVYDTPPLETVICQLKFPPILKIETDSPSEFQEPIRSEYPGLKQAIDYIPLKGPGLIMGKPIPETFQYDLAPEIPLTSIKRYVFPSEDGKWRVTLSRDFLALETTDYQRWEDFIERLQPLIELLIKVYDPGRFTRLGLRYIDKIIRSKYELQDKDWQLLINPYIIGVLGDKRIQTTIDKFESIHEIRLDNPDDRLRIITKVDYIEEDGEREQFLLFDSDYFTEVRNDEPIQKFEDFHKEATKFIRWLFKEELEKAMGGEVES